MKKELGTTGALIGATVLACLFGGLALAIYPGWPAIGRWAERADAPAWVQAVGSVAAILAAVGIAAWQRHSERTQQRRADTAAALVIGFEISSKVEMAIAAAQAMQFEYDNPTHPHPLARAQFFMSVLDTMTLPTEEQLLLLARSMPELAVDIAGGRAAIGRVRLALGLIEKQGATGTAGADVLEATYLGTKVNLLSALRRLDAARRRIQSFS